MSPTRHLPPTRLLLLMSLTGYVLSPFAVDELSTAESSSSSPPQQSLSLSSSSSSSSLSSALLPLEMTSLYEPYPPIFESKKMTQFTRSALNKRQAPRIVATRNRKILELPENTYGDVFTIEGSRTFRETYALKEPAPRQLEVNPLLGVVRLREGMKLDYEEQPEIQLTVVIARIDNTSHLEELPVTIKLIDVNDEQPRFTNRPSPFLTTVNPNTPHGTKVYHLVAHDADKDSLLRFFLESGDEGRFELDRVTGVISSLGSDPFPANKEYVLGVSVQDLASKTTQRSATHAVKVLVGERDPQFYETQYMVGLPETSSEQYRIVEVQALSHQGYPLTYELTSDTGRQSNEFAINPVTGVVDLLKTLDFERDPHQYHLRVKVVENGRVLKSSSVNLIINLLDANDNSPVFPLSQYIVQGIAETVAIGTDILQVTASDLDSVTNSQLTYSVTDSHFSVQTLNSIGYIRTNNDNEDEEDDNDIIIMAVVVIATIITNIAGEILIRESSSLPVTGQKSFDPWKCLGFYIFILHTFHVKWR